MEYYPTLQELLRHSEQSRKMFEALHTDEQVALQEQRQNIHTFADLQKAAQSFVRREHP